MTSPTLKEQLEQAKVNLDEAKYTKVKADYAARRARAYYYEAAARLARIETAIELQGEQA